jgi:AAA+ superfamily predicted ATPase
MTSITNKIRAGYPGIYLITQEEQRAEAAIDAIARDLDYHLHAWSVTTGRIDIRTGAAHGENGPDEILSAVTGLPEKSLLLLRDFHMFLKEPNPLIVRLLKDALLHAKASGKTILLLSPEAALHPEYEKLLAIEHFTLPTREELAQVLANLVASTARQHPDPATTESLLDAASGLTTNEAEDAFALSLIESGDFTPPIIAREKASAVKKNGLLELVDSPVHPDHIGGLELLKDDLLLKRNLFTREAREYGLTSPRGILAVGAPGTGKSLTAQACGHNFGIPLLRLEASSLFGSLVGQSESNWRSAFATARAIAPCVLWIDEADGLFSSSTGASNDGGTSHRVIKAILQDMQFNSENVFWTLTANDIDHFPDALIDRLDVWSVDLPTIHERQAIWSIHIAKRHRDPATFDLPALAQATDGFSGRQIEQAWLKAMTIAFNADSREPSTDDCLTAIRAFTPTSVTMADSIEARRRRLTGKARPASAPTTPAKPSTSHRKINPN